jgi:TonB family protein
MIASLLAAFAAAAAAPAVDPQPHWRVDWGEARCMLLRESSDAAPALAIRAVPGDPEPEVWVIKPHWTAAALGDPAAMRLVLVGDGGAPIDRLQLLPLERTGRYALAADAPGRDFFARLGRSNAISVQKKGLEILRLPIPGAADAVAAARSCEDDMLRKWGVDPAAFRAVKAPPRPISPQRWVRYEDYPVSALRADAAGTSVARVDVATDGRVSGCTIVSGSGSAELDKAACTALRRHARFEPAVGQQGNMVPGFAIHAVRWASVGDNPSLRTSSEASQLAVKERLSVPPGR